MRLGGNARFMTDIHSTEDLAEACRNAKKTNIAIFILGGGSNVIARDEGFNGIVLRNRIAGFEILSNEPGTVTIKAGAGENWDEVVKRTVEMNLNGIEAMSAIPGTAGAAPVQNVGAYGQEIADTLVSLEAYDIQNDTFVTLKNSECGFSYRHSIFRGSKQGRYAITSITLRLSKQTPTPPFYGAVQAYLDQNNITLYTPAVIRDAVIAIRTDKLPDPAKLPNTGSFFKNAVIDDWQLRDLLVTHPDMPHYDMPNGQHKVPTGWLIEKTGLKGKVLHGMKIHDKNALVLINDSATSYGDLAQAREEIQQAVRDMFRIELQQEPLEL